MANPCEVAHRFEDASLIVETGLLERGSRDTEQKFKYWSSDALGSLLIGAELLREETLDVELWGAASLPHKDKGLKKNWSPDGFFRYRLLPLLQVAIQMDFDCRLAEISSGFVEKKGCNAFRVEAAQISDLSEREMKSTLTIPIGGQKILSLFVEVPRNSQSGPIADLPVTVEVRRYATEEIVWKEWTTVRDYRSAMDALAVGILAFFEKMPQTQCMYPRPGCDFSNDQAIGCCSPQNSAECERVMRPILSGAPSLSSDHTRDNPQQIPALDGVADERVKCIDSPGGGQYDESTDDDLMPSDQRTWSWTMGLFKGNIQEISIVRHLMMRFSIRYPGTRTPSWDWIRYSVTRWWPLRGPVSATACR